MKPYTIHRSATETWTSTPLHFGGREYRRVRFQRRPGRRPVFVTFAVRQHKSASVMSATFLSRRAA